MYLKLSLQASLLQSTLVLAEHDNKVTPVTLKVLTAASKVGGEILW